MMFRKLLTGKPKKGMEAKEKLKEKHNEVQ